MPKKDLGFEMAVSAPVHHATLELPAHHRTHHVCIGFPSRIHIADSQTEQAVNTVQVRFAPNKLDSSLCSLFLPSEH